MKFELDIRDLPLGDIINLIRQLKGRTKAGLCEEAGLSVPTLKSVMDGNEVNLDTVFSLLRVLDIQVSYTENDEPIADLGDPFDYATVLKKIRSLKGFSQNKLSVKAECQPLTVINLENSSGARWSTFGDILQVMGVEILLTYKYQKDVQETKDS